nr:RNA-directed DNA polymerase, eukaryota, reverse transcriptase zinc-binding domain protein [Tanacetum cinerariifolium]
MNSAFFHKVIKGRINRSIVGEIWSEDNVRYSGDQIPSQFVNHFKNFLGVQSSKECLELDNDLFSNKISEQEAISMIEEVTNEEVKAAMFNIDDNKAHGPDGFTAKFYKKDWHVVGNDVCEAVKEFFTKGKLLGELNATIIILVPKVMIDEDPHNRPLKVMGVDALKEYSVALDDEEKLLFQRAKVNWLNDGDMNSAFFHKVIKGRINRSIVGEIWSEDNVSSTLETGLLDFLPFMFLNDKVAAGGYRQVKVHEFFDCSGLRQGVEDLRELLHKVSNDDTALAQRRLEDKQPEKKTNADCLVKDQKKEYQTGWKIKTGNVFDSCNQMSTQQCIKSGVAKHLGVEGIQQQNGQDTTRSTYLVNRSTSSAFEFKKPIDMLEFFGWLASIKQGMLELVKVKCIFLGYHKSIVGNKLWMFDEVTSKVVLYRNMGFNESGEYKKTFIASGVAFELFGYREDSNKAAFAVGAVEKIYAHESLTFNNTVACEVEIWVTNGLLDKAKENVLGMEIVRDQSGNTLKVSQFRFYNGKLVQTMLEGHSILSWRVVYQGIVMWKRMVSGHVYMRLEARSIR